ncbi:MAG: TIGR00730 family Rossman fold protein [Planctomycetes bacterium]|nr:TIGR00730 family Rossman fold protein [Planctomycetota bacterium]
MRAVCVFCGSSPGAQPVYRSIAIELGRELVARDLTLVYGGGNVGLMGILADAVLEAGGRAIGVIPRALLEREVGHRGLTELHVVRSMHERKALMAELSDAFLALPGGFGTFEELCEVITWAQLGIHAKPCGVLNAAGYYDPLLALFDRAVDERFVRAEHRAIVRVASSPRAILDELATARVPIVAKWIDRSES